MFSWDDWNRDHIARHGVTPDEAEYVVEHAAPPFPREVADGRYVHMAKSKSFFQMTAEQREAEARRLALGLDFADTRPLFGKGKLLWKKATRGPGRPRKPAGRR